MGPPATAVTDKSAAMVAEPSPCPLDILAERGHGLGSVIVMVGADAELYGKLSRQAGPDTQLFVVDPDIQRLRPLWSDGLVRSAKAPALFYLGEVQGFFREIPVLPSTMFVEGRAEESEAVLVEKVAPHRAGAILVYARAGTRSFDRQAWSRAGFRVEAADRSCLLLRSVIASDGVTGLEPAVFRLGAARRSKALFGSRGPADLNAPTPFGPAALLNRSARPAWPHAADPSEPLAATLPDGSPWPKISIVTPSYNQGAFIEETILSIANQGYPNVEHIVIDGGSDDETKSVLARYAHVLAYAVSEPDRGQSDAINKGMARATGEILTWLNSDDRLAPGALAAVALAFHYSKADIVAGIAELYKDGELVGRHVTACSNGPLPLDDILDLDRCWQAGQFFYQPEVMFTRELWERAGGRVEETLTYSMDYELWARFAEVGARIHVIGRPVAQFRMHASQKTHVSERFIAELRQFNQKLQGRLGRSVSGPAPEFRPVKVTLLNDVGFHFGAGTAHQRLAQALASGSGTVVTCLSLQERLESSGPVEIKRTLAALARTEPDLVLIGNLHQAAAPPALVEAVAARWPTFWTMHDFWMITGRCAYTAGCEKLLTGCDATCPTAEQYPALPRSEIAGAWLAKRRLLSGPKAPVLLANSNYTVAFARDVLDRSAPPSAVASVEPIRLGIPTEIFRPADKARARRILDLDEDAFVIMVAATAIDDHRKGSDLIAGTVAALDIPKLTVIAAGWYDPAKGSDIPNLRRMGYVDDPERMALLYSAADLFVGPSREETLGQVFIEAAACGTPSVGFRTSGVIDVIQHGVSGVLVPSLSVEALAAAIQELYGDADARRRMSVLGRIFAENEFSLSRCHQSFIAMLIRVGLIDRLRLPRNASMKPAAPKVENRKVVHALTWSPQRGVGSPEGPFAEAGLPRFRWCEGPSSAFTVEVFDSGRYRLSLRYINRFRDQRMILACNKKLVGEFELSARGKAPDQLTVSVPLQAGVNTIEMAFRFWDKSDYDERALALMLVDIGIEPELAVAA